MKTAFIKLFKTEKDATKTSHKLCSTKTAKKTAPHATVESCSCSIRKKKPLLNVYMDIRPLSSIYAQKH
jgi:hypothetical protein